MFCINCGKELVENGKFCMHCGAEVKIECNVAQTEEVQVVNIEHESTNNESTGQDITESYDEKNNKKSRSSIKVILALVCLVVVGIGVYKGYEVIKEKQRIEQEEQRERTMKLTLQELGNRSCGSNDFNTAQYSGALSKLTDAVLGTSSYANLSDLDADEIKEECFEDLEEYFETDYLKSYAVLVLGADYLERDDIEYFYNGTKLYASDLKENVEELLYGNHISLYSLLINEEDERIFYTANLRIQLAEDGYIDTQDIISEIYQFICEDEGIRTVEEDLLADSITYEQIADDISDSFSGEKLHFDDLSPVGRMVFLYLVPRYLNELDSDQISELWSFYWKAMYDEAWNEIIQRDIFGDVVK